MTYVDFLKECRRMASEREGTEISWPTFAKMCGKTPGYFRNIEQGYQPPGREVLEAAARAAGVTFEDCIRFPKERPLSPLRQKAMNTFMRVLMKDEISEKAMLAAYGLEPFLRPVRRRKTGGRTARKND